MKIWHLSARFEPINEPKECNLNRFGIRLQKTVSVSCSLFMSAKEAVQGSNSTMSSTMRRRYNPLCHLPL